MIPKRLEQTIESLFIPTIKDVMSSCVVTVRPTASVMEAVEVMTDKRVGSVIVDDKGPLGIFTEHDLINRVLKAGVPLEETKVGTVMTQPLVTLKSGDSISRAVELMHDEKISHIVVMHGEKLAGIVTMTDIRLRYSQGYMNAKLLLKKYAVDTIAYITFWSSISFVIQVLIVGITLQQLVAGTAIGLAVQVVLGGLFGRYMDLLRHRFQV